jgi:uncharacterized protein YsxB (DUF464 family)
MIASVDNSVNEDQLLFLQRMIMADENRKQIDCYLEENVKIQSENVLYELDDVIKKDYADILILDMLIIANLSKEKTKNIFNIIANIAAFMGKEKNDISRICSVATVILKQNIEGLSNEFRDILEVDKKYGYYLSEIPSWKEKIDEAVKQSMHLISAFHDLKEKYGKDWFYYTD